MSNANELVEEALDRLRSLPGFVDRPDQRQLALLLSDCIAGKSTGLFEAPTGLGKSLAALLPAIAHAMEHSTRTVVATYTNVLAEQYWRQDLPLALRLFEGEPPKVQFLIGRQRYACLIEVHQLAQDLVEPIEGCELGIESDVRQAAGMPAREFARLWRSIAAPPICPARLCPLYQPCFYYKARRAAERAGVVITNHSVVLQDAQLKQATDGDMTLLGDYDFLVIDEAHDFPQAAVNALEFELSEARLGVLSGLVGKIEQTVLPIAAQAQASESWYETCERFRAAIAKANASIRAFATTVGRPGVLAIAPDDLGRTPAIQASTLPGGVQGAEAVAAAVADEADAFVKRANRLLEDWEDGGEVVPSDSEAARESIRNYGMFIREYASGCRNLFLPEPVSVSYFGDASGGPILRHDVVDLSGPLRELVWDQVPSASMSATLAIDGRFDFFRQITGVEPAFEEVLPSPFDHSIQSAIYLPPTGAVPDPTVARGQGSEDAYFDAIASELSRIIVLLSGRTLALFHSRREMEAVYLRMSVPEVLPIYMQRQSGAAAVGERFKREVHASLFGLRSFWTGFDAPGETLSCVALVRIPFEVPVDPPQVARQAWLNERGIDPFMGYSLPLAKMLMRQGAGRLIRKDTDRGLIAILDPRVRLKRYGSQILENMPPGARVYDDLEDAVGWLGLEDV